jgi:hypothetical protein
LLRHITDFPRTLLTFPWTLILCGFYGGCRCCAQWADAGSLSLLRTLLSQESLPLLLIGAYRDNKIDPAHPLHKLLDDMRNTKPSQLTEMRLKPLAVPHVIELLRDSFRCTEAAALPFAQLLIAKTQGTYMAQRERARDSGVSL